MNKRMMMLRMVSDFVGKHNCLELFLVPYNFHRITLGSHFDIHLCSRNGVLLGSILGNCRSLC